MVDKPSDKAMGIAAQCWCDKETENKIMDVDLAVAFAKRLDNDYHAIAELTESNIKLRKENEKLNALQERYDGRDGIEWYRIKEVEYDKLIKERDQLRAENEELKAEVKKWEDVSLGESAYQWKMDQLKVVKAQEENDTLRAALKEAVEALGSALRATDKMLHPKLLNECEDAIAKGKAILEAQK